MERPEAKGTARMSQIAVAFAAIWLGWTALCSAETQSYAKQIDPSIIPEVNARDAPKETAPQASAEVVQWLDRLEEAGRKLKSFEASVHYTTFNFLTQDKQIRIGSVKYLAGETAKFLIDFEKRVVNSALRPHQVQWIFDGKWLVERNEPKRQFIKRQIVAPGSSFDPIALGSGPFPLPLGNKRDDVLRLFEVKIVAPEKDDPENSLHLALTQRKTEGKSKHAAHQFESLDIWYDKKTLMPVKVYAKDDAANEKTVRLSKVGVDKLEKEAAEKIFDTTPPPKDSGWYVRIEPWKEE